MTSIAIENDPFIDDVAIKSDDLPWQTVSHNQRLHLFISSTEGLPT
jgi:hypothetical protein